MKGKPFSRRQFSKYCHFHCLQVERGEGGRQAPTLRLHMSFAKNKNELGDL